MVRKVKAVSPLIAAVLLIVFTVAVGAVVLNWMTQYTKGTTKKAGTDTSTTVDCAKQILDISDVKYNKTSGNVVVFVQNLGSVPSKLKTVTMYDDGGNTCTNTSVDVTIPPGSLAVIQPLHCTSVDNSSYTLRVSSDCGASDVYTYPQTS